MKVCLTVGTMLLACVSMVGQNSQPAQTGEPSTGMPAHMHMDADKKSKDMSAMKGHMGKDHMRQMQAEMQQMKLRIAKMRAAAEKVKEPNAKAALLDNAEMWEHFMNQMHSHMEMMNGEGMHHMGMMKGKEGMGSSKMMDHEKEGMENCPMMDHMDHSAKPAPSDAPAK